MKDKEIPSGSVSLSLHGCAVQPSLSPRTGVRCQDESLLRLDFDPDSERTNVDPHLSNYSRNHTQPSYGHPTTHQTEDTSDKHTFIPKRPLACSRSMLLSDPRLAHSAVHPVRRRSLRPSVLSSEKCPSNGPTPHSPTPNRPR